MSDFIKDQFPKIWEVYLLAEQNVDSDPNNCISRLRLVSESLSKELLQISGLEVDVEQYKRLDCLRSYGVIDDATFSLMDYIRSLGNKAIHHLEPIHVSESSKALDITTEIFERIEKIVKAGIVLKTQPVPEQSSKNPSYHSAYGSSMYGQVDFSKLPPPPPPPKKAAISSGCLTIIIAMIVVPFLSFNFFEGSWIALLIGVPVGAGLGAVIGSMLNLRFYN